MAVFSALRVALALALSAPLGATGAQLEARSQSPVFKVVELIRNLKATIEGDGMGEQKSYDKYACWCEATLGRKALDIDSAKATLEKLAVSIPKLAAEVSSNGADVEHLKKELAQNLEATESATGVRDSENTEYQGTKADSENCVGALEAAVRALSGAGAGKKAGFMSISSRQAELMSVAAGIRQVIAKDTAVRKVQRRDLDALRHFVERPADFAGPAPTGSSFSQVGTNPFGDYAPKSTQIQGILKGMYDSMLSDMEKNHGEESNSQKAFQELMSTKQEELKDLQATLESHTLGKAEKAKMLADSKVERDDMEAQLKADETFFEATKDGCTVKADVWNERSRLRTEELQGIAQAVQILSSPDAQKIFDSAHSTMFLQLSSKQKGAGSEERSAALAKLKGIAAKYKNLGLAQIAWMLKSGGHFDKVLASIDQMVDMLRKEEQADIEHRDRCQASENKNANDMEDLQHAMEKAAAEITRLEGEASRLDGEISTLETDIGSTKSNMEERLALRNTEEADFKQALMDDSDAVQLLQKAIESMREFYKRNKIDFALVAKNSHQEPKYTENPDKAPETSWSGSSYGGQSEETSGVVAILEMVAEDLKGEMKVGRKDDANAQEMYMSEYRKMKDTLNTQMAVKLAKEKELSDVNADKLDLEEEKDAKGADKDAEASLTQSIYQDCSWVASHFQSRRDSRKAEMEGLVEAKGYLAGVESGEVI
mmetsp:Transcript_88850/g.254428  ORF Transcript_88850/g.254428 Transcript_88850/m.254428 type:complete len:716 (+) Transcript_88850:117-2264(+)